MKKKKRIIITLLIALLVSIFCFTYLLLNKKENDTPNTNINSSNQETNSIDKPISEEPSNDVTNIMITIPQIQQEKNYYCACACVQMILKYHGIEMNQDDLAKEMHTHSITGSEYVDIQRVLNKYLFNKEVVQENEPGYHIQTLEMNNTNPQIAIDFERRVKNDLNTNDFVLAAIDLKTLYPTLSTANHLVIVTGYECYPNSTKIAYYYIVDPYYVVWDTSHKGLKKIDADTLIKAIIVNEEPAYIY